MTIEEIIERASLLEGHLADYEPPPGDRLRDNLVRYDAAHRLSRIVNRIKKLADAEKNSAKWDAINRLEAEELDGAPATIDGVKVNFSKYEFRSAQIVDEDAFREWAENEDSEAWFEPEKRIRMDLLNAEVTRRDDDKEQPPPGVKVWRDERLSRTQKAGGKTVVEVDDDDE